MEIEKDEVPVIYKQDIMDENGKLNLIGTFLVVSICLIALNKAFEYLQDNIIDKDNVN